jgi:hypothetical protein
LALGFSWQAFPTDLHSPVIDDINIVMVRTSEVVATLLIFNYIRICVTKRLGGVVSAPASFSEVPGMNLTSGSDCRSNFFRGFLNPIRDRDSS